MTRFTPYIKNSYEYYSKIVKNYVPDVNDVVYDCIAMIEDANNYIMTDEDVEELRKEVEGGI